MARLQPASQLGLFAPPPPVKKTAAVRAATDGDPDGLRYYQRDAVNALLGALAEDGGIVRAPDGPDGEVVDRGHRTMAVLATGMGKTQIAGAVCNAVRGRVLFLAHRDELISQAAARLGQMTGEYVEIEQAGLRAERARLVVGSVQTLCKKARLERWSPSAFELIIVDECFPGGTPVDTPTGRRRIDSLKPGDEVWAIDHSTGLRRARRIVRTMRKPIPSRLTELRIGATTIRCTANHPVFVRGRGYVEAERIAVGDVCCMLEEVQLRGVHLSGASQNMLGHVQARDLVGDHGAHEPHARLRSHEETKSHALLRFAGEDVTYASQDWSWTEYPGGEWDWADEGAGRDPGRTGGGLGAGTRGPDSRWARERISEPLQAGLGPSGNDGLYRGGRGKPWVTCETRAGSQEDPVLAWSRVDGVAGVEPGMDDGSHVYNLEVEDCHTYFAHGTLVHNCHHSVAPSYIRVLKYFRSAKVIGLTATPDRQDEKGLGKVYDSVPYKHDIADGIRGGWLVGIRAQRFVVSEIDLRFVDTHGKDGDFVARALDEETLKGVASIVDHILKHAPNGKGIVFWPGVATARAASLYMNEKVGGSSEFISGDKGEFPTEVRKSIVERFRKGHFMWLHNCQIATEGFDVPDVDTVVLARMTKSRALYAQMVGRGLRPLIEALLGFDRKDQAEDRRVNIQWSAKPELHLMDFVGVVGEHRLVTPADLLGEGADEKVVERARKIMEQAEHAEHTEGMDPLAALAQAKVEIDELQKLVRSARVTSKATVYDIDPFEFSTVEVNNDADELDMRFGAKPATENQLIPLRKAGISEGVLQTLTRRRASALFDLLDRRREAGLAKFTQLNVLRRHIAVDDSITYDRAHEALDYLAASKWRPNPKTLEAILYGGREPGMDG